MASNSNRIVKVEVTFPAEVPMEYIRKFKRWLHETAENQAEVDGKRHTTLSVIHVEEGGRG